MRREVAVVVVVVQRAHLGAVRRGSARGAYRPCCVKSFSSKDASLQRRDILLFASSLGASGVVG